ncbi:hypothetical protein DPMN_136841 [Dreissena polymorpha]|uniref:Uncharacterized protein n=1 Tax=Dreissena polymorpha TaxID=45954 RepID=A0A9D4G4J9_DREPO|nr:hypothetical protein DPMN_136841 [Dreissena polymorpha]
MISVNLPAIDGSAVITEIMERSVRLFGKNGISEYDVVKALQTAGLKPEDIEKIAKGMSNQSIVVVLKSKLSLNELLKGNGTLTVGSKIFEVSPLSRKKIMLKIHWLPVYFATAKLGEIFKHFGKVFRVTDEHFTYNGYEIATGVRRVLMEVEAEKIEHIPHLLNFKCGARALVTMYGRPPCACGAIPSGTSGGNARDSSPSPKKRMLSRKIQQMRRQLGKWRSQQHLQLNRQRLGQCSRGSEGRNLRHLRLNRQYKELCSRKCRRKYNRRCSRQHLRLSRQHRELCSRWSHRKD